MLSCPTHTSFDYSPPQTARAKWPLMFRTEMIHNNAYVWPCLAAAEEPRRSRRRAHRRRARHFDLSAVHPRRVTQSRHPPRPCLSASLENQKSLAEMVYNKLAYSTQHFVAPSVLATSAQGKGDASYAAWVIATSAAAPAPAGDAAPVIRCLGHCDVETTLMSNGAL